MDERTALLELEALMERLKAELDAQIERVKAVETALKTERRWLEFEDAARSRLSAMLEDYGFLGHRLLDVMERALRATPLDEPWREAQSVLLARVAGDLRTVLMTAEKGYPLQALTLASSLLEHAHVAALVGADNETAKVWAGYTSTHKAFPGCKQRKMLTRALKAAPGIFPPDAIDDEVRRLESISRRFGAGKHGLPSLQRATYIVNEEGKRTIQTGPSQDAFAGAIVGHFAMDYAIEVAHSATILHMRRNLGPGLAQPIARDISLPLMQALVSIGDELQRLWQRFQDESSVARMRSGVQEESSPSAA